MFRTQTIAALLAAQIATQIATLAAAGPALAQTPADIARLQGQASGSSTSAGPYAVAFTGFTAADFARALALGAPRSHRRAPAMGAANAGAFAGADIARLRAPASAAAPAPTLIAAQ